MEGRPKRSNAVEKDYRERKRVRRRSSTDNVRRNLYTMDIFFLDVCLTR